MNRLGFESRTASHCLIVSSLFSLCCTRALPLAHPQSNAAGWGTCERRCTAWWTNATKCVMHLTGLCPMAQSFLPDSLTQLRNRVINAPLLRYVDSLRIHGHRAARIDPLDLLQREDVDALDPGRYGLIDDSRAYDVNGILWTKRVGEAFDEPEHWTLRDITNHLRSVYLGRIAYEYMHSPSKTERLWFSHILEARTPALPGVHQKKRIHRLLVQSETFDQYLQLKFPNLKRYGLEGGESMIPAMDTLFSVAARGLSLSEFHQEFLCSF